MLSTTSKLTTLLTTSKGATLTSITSQPMPAESPLTGVRTALVISTILPRAAVTPVPKVEAQNWWYWWCWWYPSIKRVSSTPSPIAIVAAGCVGGFYFINLFFELLEFLCVEFLVFMKAIHGLLVSL
ncbi:hypothetical protein WUBG_16200 [Wuchereria bancrofti]|uniref:Uncharacterized protein n=1 Tax=Wuchereria bancrofti TaxID=6293 RepID=J9AFQ3_WUCBA|nr:hypothetical protein WUBG_16200 [Wuchereria bancrofti]